MPAVELHAVAAPGRLPGQGARQRGHGQRWPVNSSPATCVLPGMRTSKPERQAGRARRRDDDVRSTPGERRRRWWRRRHSDREPARRVPGAGTDGGQLMADAIQLAVGLLTASLDSPDLEAWAVGALIPHDADGLGDFMAGLHVVSQLLLHELQEATRQPAAAILQRLAILAEARRGTPSAG